MYKKIISNPYVYVTILSFYGIWLVWDFLKLPFSNPAEVISALPKIGYNPSNNILRFLVAILVPSLACLFTWMIIKQEPRKLWKRWRNVKLPKVTLISILIVASVSLCVGMGIEQNSTNPANNPSGSYGGPYSHALVDTFHEGETLGPALAYEQPNLAPYRDFVMIHGVFQDAFRSVIAFKLFGTSIGATRAFSVILAIVAFVSYYVLLLVLFRGNIFKSILGLCVMAILMLPTLTLPFIGNHILGIQFPFRDIATVLFLISAIVGLRLLPAQKKKLIVVSSIIGFIVVAGFANSMDRALYISALSIVWLVLMLIVHKPRYIKTILIPYIVGATVGIPVLGLALKWAFSDFFNYVFTMSRYKEFLDGIILVKPDFAVGVILITISSIITLSGAVVINRLVRKSSARTLGIKARSVELIKIISPLISKHSVEILLFITGLFFLRSAIGRALPDHWVYSVQWIYLFLFYITINYIYTHSGDKKKLINVVAVIMLGICLVFYGAIDKRIDIRNDTFPIHVQDEQFMKTDYIETANYLKNNLKEDETFVTLTSEWSWYYFVGKPSPIKYPVIWYAFTKSEREGIAQDLENGVNIKYIITNNNWTSAIDYVTNEERFPEVYSVLKNRYVQYVGFGQQTIWIRK